MYEAFEDKYIAYNEFLLNSSNIQRYYYNGKNTLKNETIIYIDLNFTNDSTYKYIYIDLGWENYPKIIFDLDIMLILFDQNNNDITTVFYDNNIFSEYFLLEDNRIGNNIYSNETATFTFNLFDSEISSIAIIINSFKRYKLKGLKSGYIKLDNSFQIYLAHINFIIWRKELIKMHYCLLF